MTSPMFDLPDLPDLPDHFPIALTVDGHGPAEPHEAHRTACWCGDPTCMLFYGASSTPPSTPMNYTGVKPE
jgi:hypothetical protein